MDTFDFVIIGAGPAGEAAAYKARELGATVAVIDRLWFGGSCPHIGCLPSKSLLHGAAEHHANPAAILVVAGLGRARLHGQPRRPTPPSPTTRATSRRLRGGGRDVVYRGDAHDRRAGRVEVRHDEPGPRARTPRNVVVAVGSRLEGPADRRASRRSEPGRTARRRSPASCRASLLVLGGGPTGCELAQVYARFGVPTTIVQSGAAARPDRPSAQLRGRPRGARARRRRRPDRRPRACAARAGAGHGRRPRHRPRRRLDRRGPRDPARRRAVVPARRPRPRALRHRHERPDRVPARRPAARSPTGCGSSATRPGPELHTHQAHYQGELAVRMALGDDVEPDYRALPRATYTDPEAASSG